MEVLGGGGPDVDDPGRFGPDRDLLHVHAGPGVEHGPPLGHGDDRDGVAPTQGGEGGAVDRVDGHVGFRTRTVAYPLTVEQHRGVILLALADHDDTVHLDGADEAAHSVHGGAVGAILDETMGYLLPIIGEMAYTANLSIDYIAPAPLGVEVSFTARLRDRADRKLWIEAVGESEDGVFVRAEALFLTVDLSRFTNAPAEDDSVAEARTQAADLP